MPSTIQTILSSIEQLDPFPAVAVRVLELAGREETSPKAIAEVVQTDAALVAKVLKLANCAAYAFRREIGSLDEAAVRLGTSGLCTLVMTSATGRYLAGYGASTARTRELHWRKTVATALAARLVALVDGGIDPGRAYTVGLLQNIGHVVMDRFLDEARDTIRFAVEAGAAPLDAERAILGIDHADLGARMAQRWNFPESLVLAIRFHHAPERAGTGANLCYAAQLAEALALEALAAEFGDEQSRHSAHEVLDPALEQLRGGAQRFSDVLDLLRQELRRKEALLEL